MTLVGKILGQASPSASTDTPLYSVPIGKQATARVSVCNTNASSAVVRVFLMLAADAASPTQVKQRVMSKTVNAGETFVTDTYALSSGDKIAVWADSTNVAFNANGFEETL